MYTSMKHKKGKLFKTMNMDKLSTSEKKKTFGDQRNAYYSKTWLLTKQRLSQNMPICEKCIVILGVRLELVLSVNSLII